MKPKPLILIVDDEKNTREGLKLALDGPYRVQLAADGNQALEFMTAHEVDVVLSDIRMPGIDGLTLIRRALTYTPQPVCILLTAYGSIETAVEAMKNGAYDFLTKPVNLDRLDLVLQRALRNRDMEKENATLRSELDARYGLDKIVGQSSAMKYVFETIQQAAPSRATMLIQGESGTGKELVAHAIHRLSPRSKGPFVAVHCAALTETLLESELFGHEKGAFTGANERRQGRFEMADGGTLFLDEISEISPSVQVKILRVLEERQFERVGGQKTVRVDVRLVAATNKNLDKLVEKGIFRHDLFFRLNVIRVDLPPLRERENDIAILAHHFLKTLSEENGKTIIGFTPDVLDAFQAYSWPGNVREMRNIIERMVVLSRTDKLGVKDLPPDIRPSATTGRQKHVSTGKSSTLEDAEKQLIINALETHGGNRTKAAEQLGISRRTLHRKLNEYQLRE